MVNATILIVATNNDNIENKWELRDLRLKFTCICKILEGCSEVYSEPCQRFNMAESREPFSQDASS